MTKKEKRLFQLLFALSGLIVLIGMFIPIMEVDAAQYASISKQMFQDHSFLEIIHRNLNYLDKPPLLFWLSGASISLFGVNDFAYKLPSVLFSILGVWSTFRFARHFYGEKTGYWAALMYCTSVAFFLFNSDIRTDTILINLLIFSVYHLVVYKDTGSWKAFILAFVGIGVGMLAKGPMGLVFPVLAIGGDVIMHRNWKFIFKWQWLLGLLIVAIVLLPMCIGLYTQFDANPDAWVNNEKGVSGLKFYFWTQSFGRITGESIWATAYSNNPDTFYLTTTFLWAFLPWTPLFIAAFIRKIIGLVKRKFKVEEKEQWICFFAFLLPLIALSRSGYQLNHYIYVVVPFTSVMAAKVLVDWQDRKGGLAISWKVYSWVFSLAVFGISFFILYQVFPTWLSWPVLALMVGSFLLFRNKIERPSFRLAITVLVAFAVMNGYFYPTLLKYQLGHRVSDLYDSLKTENSRFYFYKTGVSHSLDYYQKRWVPGFSYEATDSLLDVDHVYVYTNRNGLKAFQENDIHYSVLDSMDFFRVTQLNWKFLNPEKRQEVTRKRFFIELKD